MTSDPRDDLAALIHNCQSDDPARCLGPTDFDYQRADAIIAAGWVQCQHRNQSGFRNNDGPWFKRCADCGKEWEHL